MSNKHLVVEIATWGSVSYVQSLALRFDVLRKPLGLVFDPAIFLQENLDVHLIAKHGDWVVGCMILTPKEQQFKMRQVAVDPRFQRQGVGSKMVEYAEQYAAMQQGSAIVLHARDSAIPFYHALGYSTVGEGFEEVGIPHHAMQKSLVG